MTKMVICEICKRRFKNARALSMHKRYAHSAKNEVSPDIENVLAGKPILMEGSRLEDWEAFLKYAANKRIQHLEQKQQAIIPQASNESKAVKALPVTLRNWLGVIGGAVLTVAGLGGCVVWYQNRNEIIAIISVLALCIGLYLVWRGYKERDAGVIYTDDKGETVTKLLGNENSINIYAQKIGDNTLPLAIKFENIKNPKGYPRKLRNNGKRYYVHINDIETGELLPFMLPDKMLYYDPREYARALTMPAHRKMFTRRMGLLEKLKPLWVFGAMVIMWLVMITVE